MTEITTPTTEADALRAQIFAGVRQLALIFAPLFGLVSLPDVQAFLLELGAGSKYTAVLSVGATLVAFIWGQIATRKAAKAK